jgi:hypothetical protein
MRSRIRLPILLSLVGFSALFATRAKVRAEAKPAGSASSATPSSAASSSGAAAAAGSVRARIPTTLVANSSTPASDVSSAVDARGALHVVYTQESGEVEDLYYVKVAGAVVSTPVRVTSLALRRVRHAHVAVDGDVVHVAFFVVRKKDVPTRTGNYGVYYARGGAGSFTVEQVSENASDPADDGKRKFNAYVNDRPRVFFDGSGQPVVAYLSAVFDGWQGSGNYVVFATRSGAAWSREQAFRPTPYHSVDEGVAPPERWQSTRQVAYYDIANYQPHLVTFGSGRWNDLTVDGPSGFTNLDEVTLSYDAKGGGHLTWIAKKDQVFVHRTVTGTTLGPIEKIPVARLPWSNFAPTAIDPVTDKVWFLYEDVTRDDDRHRVLAPTAVGGHREVGVPTFGDLPGSIRGHGSFHVRNGRAFVVTASTKAGGIFATQFTP